MYAAVQARALAGLFRAAETAAGGGTGAKTLGQPRPLPLYPCPKSPLARGSHSGQTWQGT
jgi:hypothetical protein